MVEGIQSSHQVNSFPFQAAAGILPDQQMLLSPFHLLQGQSTERPLPVALRNSVNASSHAFISVSKDSKTDVQPQIHSTA